ncbi:hypothetical protein BDV35DRAFT_371964 [Aspergillus flavus]|uniref:Uncharacterized protein n=1 Tax=Aspergillus flavus TaxID=5059 RepID=A0A5N6GI37_ASPFL|nr:hypothetical protein BDV35DRAFT_371964 [Aspergillus flavus]
MGSVRAAEGEVDGRVMGERELWNSVTPYTEGFRFSNAYGPVMMLRVFPMTGGFRLFTPFMYVVRR